ncbi:MAG: hypothetical protein ABSA79_10405 [Candidatus Bathyarchaeia archaeon]|jgi:hypothetical protein
MRKNLKITIVATILIVVALDAALWATYTFYNPSNQPFNPFNPVPPPPNGNPGDLEIYYFAESVISSLNIALLVFLLISNADLFRKTRTKFTFGLLIFSAAFLVKDLTSSPLVISVFGYRQVGLGPFALLPDLFELVVLVVLLYLSFE